MNENPILLSVSNLDPLNHTAKIRRFLIPAKCWIFVRNTLIQVKSKNKNPEMADLAMHFG